MRMKRVVFTAALLCGLAAPSFASSLTYTATLSGAAQVPANASKGTGFVTYTLTGDLLTVDLTFTGLSAPAAAAHIHCCAAANANAAVVLPFAGFPGATFGTYMNTFNLSTFAFGGGVSEAQLIAGLNDGMTYTNIHDANYPGGRDSRADRALGGSGAGQPRATGHGGFGGCGGSATTYGCVMGWRLRLGEIETRSCGTWFFLRGRRMREVPGLVRNFGGDSARNLDVWAASRRVSDLLRRIY